MKRKLSPKEYESELKKLGFNRKWHDDKSGYWFEKKVGDFLKFYADSDIPKFELGNYVEVIGCDRDPIYSEGHYMRLKSYKTQESLLEAVKKAKVVV